MKTMRLVIGIISIVFSLAIFVQSCAACFVEAIETVDGRSGTVGLLVFLLMLSTGIVAIAARKSQGAAVYCTIIYSTVAVLGITTRGVFKDLFIWGIVALIFAILFFISTFFTDSEPNDKPPPPPPYQYWNYPHQ